MPAPADPPAGTAARALAALAALAVLAALAAGCTFDTPIPKGKPLPVPATAPTELRMTTPGEPQGAFLDCAKDDCNHWWRVDVAKPATLRARMERTAGPGEPTIRMLVREMGKPILARGVSGPGEPIEIETPVSPGLYGVLVQAGQGEQAYTLTVWLDPPPPPGSAPPPRDVDGSDDGEPDEASQWMDVE